MLFWDSPSNKVFTAVLLSPYGATAKHGNYYSQTHAHTKRSSSQCPEVQCCCQPLSPHTPAASMKRSNSSWHGNATALAVLFLSVGYWGTLLSGRVSMYILTNSRNRKKSYHLPRQMGWEVWSTTGNQLRWNVLSEPWKTHEIRLNYTVFAL